MSIIVLLLVPAAALVAWCLLDPRKETAHVPEIDIPEPETACTGGGNQHHLPAVDDFRSSLGGSAGRRAPSLSYGHLGRVKHVARLRTDDKHER